MEKKKGRKKKIRFNYFLKRKIIISVCLILVFVGGIVTVFAITDKKDEKLENQSEVEKVIPAECPYTLDEIEEKIKTNWLYDGQAFGSYRESAEEFAFVLFNFYKYFNKDTEFIVWDEVDEKTWEPLSYKKIDYEQYQKYIQTSLNACNLSLESGGSKWSCVSALRLFMLHDAKFVKK